MKTTGIIALLTLACLATSFPNVEAQEHPRTFRNTLAIQPLYWLNNGMRIDYERQLKNPRHWLQVSAIGYYVGDDNSLWMQWLDRDIRHAWGVGLETNYKYFPFGKILYVSGGLSAAHYSVQYNEWRHTFLSYQENALTYYEPQWEEVKESSNFARFGTNVFVGVQNRPGRRFLIDGYAGVGRVFSFYDAHKAYPDNYLNSLSYRGITLTLGLRIGFRL
ncbi:MAG: hypothetical protein LBB84_01385 [Tannerellaceae bacterium]|jgi:hypothetical protein|nr:hypothetical protein [Tannerellaceae bacterium]